MPFETTFKILTSGAWPESIKPAEEKLILNPLMLKVTNIFEAFYRANNKDRRVTWAASQCGGELLFKSQYTLVCNNEFMLVLLMFNDTSVKGFTVEELSNGTGIPSEELRKNILVPLVSRFNLLNIEWSGPPKPATELTNSDFIYLVETYAPASKRISLIAPRPVAANVSLFPSQTPINRYLNRKKNRKTKMRSCCGASEST